MPRQYKLTARQFKYLFEKILTKYQGNADFGSMQSNASQFFGFGENHDPYPRDGSDTYDPTIQSLKKSMLQVEKVVKTLTQHFGKVFSRVENKPGVTIRHRFNGQNLYNKYKEIYENEGRECIIEDPYATVYANFIGFERMSEFLDTLPAETLPNILSAPIGYKAYYYSYWKHDIKVFNIQIDYSNDPFVVRQKGFHEHRREPEYLGEAFLSDGKIHAVLNDEISGDEMNMTISSGNDPEDQDAMLGALQAISSHEGNHPLCCEIILVRESYALTPEEELRIKRFLFLHRYNFRIREENINLKSLTARGREVDMIDYLSGYYYRVWRFDEEYNVIQSVMHINSYYKTICYTNQYGLENYDEQVCLVEINVNDILACRTLCISAHPRQGVGIISYLMLNLPPRMSSGVMGGIICINGQSYPVVRSIAMMKDDRIAENFDRKLLKKFSLEDAKGEVATDKRLEPLFKKLLEEERRNTKPGHIRDYLS